MDTQQELCKFLEAHFETIQNEYFGIDKEKFILWGGEGVKTPSFSKIDGEHVIMETVSYLPHR
jgi:hypothetical protein